MVFGDICKLNGQGELKGSTGKFAERRKSVLQWCCINCCAWVAVGVSCCHGVRYALVALRFSQGFRVVQVDQVVCWHAEPAIDHLKSSPPAIKTSSNLVEPDQPCPEYRSLLFLLPQWFTVAVHLKH